MTNPTSAVPRLAAAVVLVRDRPTGDGEVFLLRRHKNASFMASAFVFPGGTAEEGEELRTCAARELFEEAGVLVARETLIPFAHWITPSIEPKRFSAHFFVARLPPAQTPAFDNVETVDEIWVTPHEALERAGELRLPPPQLRTMYELAQAPSLTSAAFVDLAHSRSPHIEPFLPRALPGGSELTLLLSWDPDYARGRGDLHDLAANSPLAFGPSRCTLTAAGWELSSPTDNPKR